MTTKPEATKPAIEQGTEEFLGWAALLPSLVDAVRQSVHGQGKAFTSAQPGTMRHEFKVVLDGIELPPEREEAIRTAIQKVVMTELAGLDLGGGRVPAILPLSTAISEASAELIPKSFGLLQNGLPWNAMTAGLWAGPITGGLFDLDALGGEKQ
jgi:hypothetical protein